MTTATMTRPSTQRARKIASGLKTSPVFADRNPAAAQDLSDESSDLFKLLDTLCAECEAGN